MELIDLSIGGEARPALSGATFERIDPVTGTVATIAAAATVADAIAKRLKSPVRGHDRPPAALSMS